MEWKKKDRNTVLFISYRTSSSQTLLSQDSCIQKLETFRIPKKLITSDAKNKIGHVFKDDEELPVSDNLSADIENALLDLRVF